MHVSELEKLRHEYKEKGLEILMVNVKESKSVVSEYITKNRFTLVVLLDKDGKAYRDYSVFGLPSTYFVDAEGTVRYSYMGELTWGITNGREKRMRYAPSSRSLPVTASQASVRPGEPTPRLSSATAWRRN